MKFLRTTYWSPTLSATTLIVSEHDVVMPLEEISYDASGDAYIVDDIFEFDGEHAAGLAEGTARANDAAKSEANQAIMFFWLHQQFRIVRQYGVIGTERPAPFDVTAIKRVFKQLSELPDYKDFAFVATANDGTPVQMNAGGVFT